MCWITRYDNISKKIAEEDIRVFKLVMKDDFSPDIRSYYYNFRYELHKEYVGKINLDEREQTISGHIIRNGFHSYNKRCSIKKTKKNAIDVYSSDTLIYIDRLLGNLPTGKLVKMNCIIPKGSEYYENEFGEIVSDRLKPVSIEKL